jgi:hypothetical protein
MLKIVMNALMLSVLCCISGTSTFRILTLYIMRKKRESAYCNENMLCVIVMSVIMLSVLC